MAIDFLSAVGAGSGINITELADSLVEAERAPRQESIDRKTQAAELRISAYGVVKNALNTLKDAFGELDDFSEINQTRSSSSNTSVLSASASAYASVGSLDVVVNQLAQRDSWIFDGFSATDESLNGGSGFSINVVQVSGTTQVNVANPTPDGIVTALNESGLGLTASLINTGASPNTYVLTVSGALGNDSSFNITSDPSAILTGATRVSTASDSQFTLNGVSITRSVNTVSDVLEGVTLNLSATGSASLEVSKDTSVLKQKLVDLVEAYNGVKTVFDTLRSRDDVDDELSGALSSDSTFRSLESAIRNKMSDEISSASGSISYLTEIGISFNREGFLDLDDDRLDQVLTSQFDDVVTVLSNNTDDQSIYGSAAKGLAGDMVALVDTFNRTTGAVTSTINNSKTKLLSYEKELLDLESRMERIKSRYLNQFAAMQRVVDQMNSTSEYLTNNFNSGSKD